MPVADDFVSTAFAVGLESVTVNVSSPSTPVSPTIGTATVPDVEPAGIVNVHDLDRKSTPAVAVPADVAKATVTGVEAAPDSVTVNVIFVNNFVYFLLLIFSGANLDLNAVPSWVRATSTVLPLTNGIAAARDLVAGASLTEIAPHLGWELAIGLTYGLLGYFLFHWFVRRPSV